MYQICIWANNNIDEYNYIKSICKAIDEDLTDDDFFGSSLTINGFGQPNLAGYDSAVASNRFRPIIIFPFSNPGINIQLIANVYPDYYFIQPLYAFGGPAVPSALVVDPDRVTPLVLIGAGEDGLSGWQTGESLVFTESSYDYDNYPISAITDNGDGTCRIRCESPGHTLQWSYFVDAFSKKIPVYLKNVSGFSNNPDGVYYPVAESYYTNNSTNWVDITHNLGSGSYAGGATAGFNFLSGAAAVVGAKLNKIRRERGISYEDAVTLAKLTASNPERDNEHGFGNINVDDAINYEGEIPADEAVSLGDIQELSLDYDEFGMATLSMPEVLNANLIVLYKDDEPYNYQELDYAESYEYSSALPAGNYKARAFSGYEQSEFSNEITVNIMALTNKPIKSKYTVGDTVYYNNLGSISELTINSVIVEVDNPNNDGTGRQINKYTFEEIAQTIVESYLFASKNSLICSIKGEYLNKDGVNMFLINSILASSSLSYNDIAGIDFQGFAFNEPDPVSDPGGNPFEFEGAITDGCNFEDCIMPAAADTKSEFKALVTSYDKDTTIWTDGDPIGI